MSKFIRKIIFIVCVLALITSLSACDDSEDDGKKWAEERYAELMSAPTPTVHASKDPFALGELIPPTLDLPRWQIQYGSFPVMAGSYLFRDLGNAFANEFLGSQTSPVRNAEKRAIMYDFINPGGFNTSTYDAEQEINFDEAAALNLMLLADFNQEDRAHLEKETGKEIASVEIAKEAVVFIVHEDNPVNGLTSEQLSDVMTGKITNWSELGGDSREIDLYYEPSKKFQAKVQHKALGEGLK